MEENDHLLDAVADQDRRRLLVSLLDHNPQQIQALSDVSRDLAQADEGLLRLYLKNSQEIADVDEELLRLQVVHIPKLVEYGFIEWDQEERVVTKGPRFDEIRPLVKRLADDPDARLAEWI